MVTDEGTRRHILVADDESDLRSLLRDLLEGEGYQVTEAKSGTEVLTMLAKGSEFALVIMDVRMPGIDGLEVLERMRKNNDDI